ncbi:MAG: VOC family protein [Jatrophihabitans sp.]|uniref:VOC family protein n=1 Tax=Jatrophihabitans sp. TaxID=1932789 RepID=UPI00390F0E4F
MSPLDSVTVTSSDFAAALEFYDAALGALGLVRVSELVDEEEDGAEVEAVAWGDPDGTGVLWLVAGSTGTTGLHVRFTAHSQVQVETFHHAAVAAGGRTFTAPRRWPLYRRGEFNAIVADPAGNLVEAVGAE